MTKTRTAEPARSNLILTLLGRKGSGKTYLATEIASEHPRVLALDTVGEYGAAQGFEVHDTIPSAANRLAALEHAGRFRISARADHTDDLLLLLDVAWHMGNLLVIVEEASFFCSPSYLPDDISRLIRYGRHRRVSQLYISRRASEIHREITAQSDLIVSFQQREPRDIEYLAACSGESARRLAVLFRSLPRYRVFVWGELELSPLAVIQQRWEVQGRLPLDDAPDAGVEPAPAEGQPSP